MGTMTVGAKYRTTLRDPGTSGVLSMSEDNFTFTPDDPWSPMELIVDFQSIKGHKFNKVVDGSKPKPPLLNLSQDSDKGEGYYFEFDNVGNRDLCRDFAARVLSKHQGTVPPRSNVPPKLVESIGPEKLSSAEMEQRMKLLREDSELQKLHKKFVVCNILQESEFWVTRKNLLDDEANKASKQKPGLKSPMVADVTPSDDGQALFFGTEEVLLRNLWQTNKATFNLTNEMMHEVYLRVSFTTPYFSTVISAVLRFEEKAISTLLAMEFLKAVLLFNCFHLTNYLLASICRMFPRGKDIM